MFGFEKLDIYREGIKFVKGIYQLTDKFPERERFGITDQLRRAAVSVVLNIAEGNGRSTKEYIHFLITSRGSLNECVASLDIALELNYIEKEERNIYYNKAEILSKEISSLINSLKRRNNE